MEVINTNGIPEHIKNALSSKGFKAYLNKQDDAAEILIFDEIGQNPYTGTGVSASDVAMFLAQNRGTPVNVRINSPGGLAFDGITIHNALVQHDAPVTTTVEGLAASAATIISAAGGRTGKARMYENTTYFIHRAIGLAYGNVDAMAEVSEWLNKIDEQIARTYAARSGKSYVQMLGLMRGKGKADGSVLTAREAKDLGLIDEIVAAKGNKEPRNDSEIAEQIRQVQDKLLAGDIEDRKMEIAARLKSIGAA